jgi:hypothetical protein
VYAFWFGLAHSCSRCTAAFSQDWLMSRSSAATTDAQPQGLCDPDRRQHPRYRLSIPGRFMRADKLDYPCRLQDISIAGAAMTTPAKLKLGEHIIAYFLHLGGLEGTVVRRFDDGFAMSISATQRKREKIAAQILRLSNQGIISETEERQYPRRSSIETFTMWLADGTELQCPVLDVSRSGVSLVAPIRPTIGAQVIVEGQPATVVRHHDDGVAVEFLNEKLGEGDGVGGMQTAPE